MPLVVAPLVPHRVEQVELASFDTLDLSGDVGGTLAQVAPATGGAATTGAPSAPSGGGGGAPSSGFGGGGMMQLLFPVLIFVAFYFFLIRPQQRKAKELDSKLKKGDRVFTSSGIIGKIVNITDQRAWLEIAPGVKIECKRSAIGGIDEGDDPKKAPQDDAKVVEAKK